MRTLLITILLTTQLYALDSESLRHMGTSAALTTGFYMLFDKGFNWNNKLFSYCYAAALTFMLGTFYEAATEDYTTFKKDMGNNMIGIIIATPIMLW